MLPRLIWICAIRRLALSRSGSEATTASDTSSARLSSPRTIIDSAARSRASSLRSRNRSRSTRIHSSSQSGDLRTPDQVGHVGRLLVLVAANELLDDPAEVVEVGPHLVAEGEAVLDAPNEMQVDPIEAPERGPEVADRPGLGQFCPQAACKAGS